MTGVMRRMERGLSKVAPRIAFRRKMSSGSGVTPLRRGPAIAADLALAGLVVALRAELPRPLLDDAYIVLSVVRNALLSLGPHLDPASGDAVLSTMAWPALIGSAVALGAPPVAALRALGFASEIALALVVRRLATNVTHSLAAGTFAAAALATHPLLLLPSLGGMETALMLAALGAAAWATTRRKAATAAALAGLLPWIRVDGMLAAIVLLAAQARDRRSVGAGWWAGAALAAGAPVLHRVVFGAWLPATVAAKAAIAVGDYAAGVREVALEFARSLTGRSAYWLVDPSPHWVMVPLALLGIWRLTRRGWTPASRAVTIWAALYVAAFVLSGRAYARNFPWYFTPPLLAIDLLAAVGLADAVQRLPVRWRVRGAWLPVAIPLLVFLASFPTAERSLHRVASSFTAHRERAYAAAAIWMGRYGPADSIASNEIGALAWFSPPGTEVVDLLGLSRRQEDLGRPTEEVLRRRRPRAVVGRIDFRLRSRVEAALPGEYLWIGAGSLELGLAPELAARLRPHITELKTIYSELGVRPEMGARSGGGRLTVLHFP